MNKNMSFETAIERLNEIVELMESGEQPLDQLMKLYEEGSSLASFCYKKLASAEQKIKQITELEEKGGKSDE